MCVYLCECTPLEGWYERPADILDLELQTVVNGLMWVLWKNKKCSYHGAIYLLRPLKL